MQCVMQTHGQDLERVLLELRRDIPLRVLRQRHPAEVRLDHDLPCARGAEEDLVPAIRDESAGASRELIAVGDPPEEGVGVEQQSHSKCFARSFGSGASKSGETTIRPRAVPGVRRSVRGLSGTIFATGLPALAMVISSPRRTRSMRRERCVFASWMLIARMQGETRLSGGLTQNRTATTTSGPPRSTFSRHPRNSSASMPVASGLPATIFVQP